MFLPVEIMSELQSPFLTRPPTVHESTSAASAFWLRTIDEAIDAARFVGRVREIADRCIPEPSITVSREDLADNILRHLGCVFSARAIETVHRTTGRQEALSVIVARAIFRGGVEDSSIPAHSITLWILRDVDSGETLEASICDSAPDFFRTFDSAHELLVFFDGYLSAKTALHSLSHAS